MTFIATALDWIVGSKVGRVVGAIGAALGLILVGLLALARMRSTAREEGRQEAQNDARARTIDMARQADDAVRSAGPDPRNDERVRGYYRD